MYGKHEFISLKSFLPCAPQLPEARILCFHILSSQGSPLWLACWLRMVHSFLSWFPQAYQLASQARGDSITDEFSWPPFFFFLTDKAGNIPLPTCDGLEIGDDVRWALVETEWESKLRSIKNTHWQAVVSYWDDLLLALFPCPGTIWQMSGDVEWGGFLLVLIKYGPGMQMSIPWCTGQPPKQRIFSLQVQ